MNAKEVKAALADEAVQAAIEKEVAKAVKAETKRCLDEVKAVTAEQVEACTEGGMKAEAKLLKQLGKDIIAKIKD